MTFYIIFELKLYKYSLITIQNVIYTFIEKSAIDIATHQIFKQTWCNQDINCCNFVINVSSQYDFLVKVKALYEGISESVNMRRNFATFVSDNKYFKSNMDMYFLTTSRSIYWPLFCFQDGFSLNKPKACPG